mgnify:CR=1 FL=1
MDIDEVISRIENHMVVHKMHELHRAVHITEALEIIKMLDLKEITPPWDDGNQNHARKYVSRNSSGNWSR